jgi:hypothetical protein
VKSSQVADACVAEHDLHSLWAELKIGDIEEQVGTPLSRECFGLGSILALRQMLDLDPNPDSVL